MAKSTPFLQNYSVMCISYSQREKKCSEKGTPRAQNTEDQSFPCPQNGKFRQTNCREPQHICRNVHSLHILVGPIHAVAYCNFHVKDRDCSTLELYKEDFGGPFVATSRRPVALRGNPNHNPQSIGYT